MTVLELIDELSKQEPHSKVAIIQNNEVYGRVEVSYDDVVHVIPRKDKTETSLEPEDLVVLY